MWPMCTWDGWVSQNVLHLNSTSTYFKVRTSEYLLQNFISLCLWNYVTILGFGALLMGSSSALWRCPGTSHLEPSALIGYFHLNIGCLVIEKRSRECKRQSVIANVGCIHSGYGWRGRGQSSGGPLFSGLRHKRSSDSFMSSLALAFPRIWTLSTPGSAPVWQHQRCLTTITPHYCPFNTLAHSSSACPSFFSFLNSFSNIADALMP